MKEEGGVKRVGSCMVEAGHNLRKNGCCMVGECFRLCLELKAIASSEDVQRMCRVKARCRAVQRWRGITSTAFSTFLSFVKGKQGKTSKEQ